METKSMTNMANWDDIPLELAQKIGEKIDLYEDFIAFGRVCRWWRLAMKLARKSRASRQTPWLMFSEGRSSLKCHLYDLYNGTVQDLELPNPHANNSNGKNTTSTNECHYFSTHGWVVCLFLESRNIVLIDPTSGRVIQPPSLPNCCYLSSKFTMLANPLTTSDYTLAVMSYGEIRLCSSNDNEWIVQDHGYQHHARIDITFYNGGLYSLTNQGQVIAYERTNDRLTQRVVASLHWTSARPGSAYMVELAGVLFVILREVERQYGMTVSFKVWKVNVENGEVKEVNNLRNKAVFVGFNSSFSVEASPTYCKPNCIYYTDDINSYCYFLRADPKDLGVYDLSSGTVTQDCFQGFPEFSYRLPLWVEKPPSTPYSYS